MTASGAGIFLSCGAGVALCDSMVDYELLESVGDDLFSGGSLLLLGKEPAGPVAGA